MDKDVSLYDIEDLLQENSSVVISPDGWSMYPLLIPRVSAVELVAWSYRTEALRRGDVVLFRSEETNHLVLHRICRVKQEGIYLVGDNQTRVEGPVAIDSVLAKMIAFQPNQKNNTNWISCKHIGYRFQWRIWMCLRPFRGIVGRIVHLVKVFFSKEKKNRNDGKHCGK